MLELSEEKREVLLEALYDLKHDLGKYIKLPVVMLPSNATWEEVVVQIEKSVLCTRKSSVGNLSAQDLFDRFDLEWGNLLLLNETYGRLKETVSQAVRLPAEINLNNKCMNRYEAEQVLGAVSAAISELIHEVSHE